VWLFLSTLGSKLLERKRWKRVEKDRDQDGAREDGKEERKMETTATGGRWGMEAARRESADGRRVREEEGREERKERDDMDNLTCGADVGPTLTQLPRQAKPGSKPPKDPK
jgi:hypothetical protein